MERLHHLLRHLSKSVKAIIAIIICIGISTLSSATVASETVAPKNIAPKNIAPKNVASKTNAEEYYVGVVPQFNVREIERIWAPILKNISEQTGLTLKLKPSPSIPEFEKLFKSGQYHFAYMNPYHALVANRNQGYQPLVRDIKKQLKGVIVVHKDSPITNIQQLDGKKVAMPAPNALGASLLPRAEFANVYNIRPDISYVKSHDSVYLNVALGLMDAGGGVMASFNKQPASIRNNLRITHTTQGVPGHPFTAHPKVPAKVIKQVQDALLTMGETKEGKALLAQIPIKEIGITTLKDYDPLIKLGLEKFYVNK